MKQNQLFKICLGIAVLGVAYFLTEESFNAGGGRGSERQLLAGVAGDKVANIRLEQGDASFELLLKDGLWQMPKRGGYPVDPAKVRALLLKLFDLRLSQRLPSNPDSLVKLGLTEESIKSGRGKISLSDAEGQTLAVVRLGQARKGQNEDQPLGGMLNGQYVRLGDDPVAYVMAAPLNLSFEVSSWIDANLVNVLPASVLSISAGKLSGAERVLEFDFVRAGEPEKDTGFPSFRLKGDVPDGKSVQQTAVSQLRSALENLRTTDVFPQSAAEIADLKFDNSMAVRTLSGLVYSVETGKKEEKYFARLAVSFDQSAITEAEQIAQAAKLALAQPSPAATTPAQSASSAQTATPSPTPKPIPTPAPANEAEATRLNQRLSPWVFELLPFQAQQLRKSRNELFEGPATANSTAGSAASSAASLASGSAGH